MNGGNDNTYSYLGGNGQRSSSSAWLEKQQSANRKSKFMVCPSVAPILFTIEWMSGRVTGEVSWPLAKGFVMLDILVLSKLID